MDGPLVISEVDAQACKREQRGKVEREIVGVETPKLATVGSSANSNITVQLPVQVPVHMSSSGKRIRWRVIDIPAQACCDTLPRRPFRFFPKDSQ